MPTRSRLRRVTRPLALLFLLVAAGEAALMPVPLIDPNLLTGKIECRWLDCRFTTEPRRLIPEGGLAASVPAEERLPDLTRRSGTRLLLLAAAVARRLPQALLFLFLALALRRLGAPRPFGSTALLWMRRAAAAAVVAVVLQPVSDSLRATALSPLLTGRLRPFIRFDGPTFLWGLLLAAGVWVCVWALEEARRVEAELAEIV